MSEKPRDLREWHTHTKFHVADAEPEDLYRPNAERMELEKATAKFLELLKKERAVPQ